MSDLNQISNDTTEQKQEEVAFINDYFKTISISDENDSEYEDIDEDEIIDTSVLTSITNKSSSKAVLDDEELLINIRPRRTQKKIQDEDNQSVPKAAIKINKGALDDDDNNTQSPAYIPRKGKFYEHDDRTMDENDRSKQEISRNENRLYKDSGAKWQHDLYFRDQQISKSRHSIPKRTENHSKPSSNHRREQLHLNDYIVRSQPDQYNDYRRQIPHESERKPRTNDLNFQHSLSYNRGGFNRDRNIQTAPWQRRGEYNTHQIDERTFHRRRNFTNSQFQGNDDFRQYEGLRKYELNENTNNLPPRLRVNNDNHRNATQKQEYQANASTNIERPKRYSNMRNNMTNTIQSQAPSQIKSYQNQYSNQFDQNDWPQAPPPPTSYPLQQQYHPQSTSRYVPINYPSGPMFEQFQTNK